jgi:hypothetical protein
MPRLAGGTATESLRGVPDSLHGGAFDPCRPPPTRAHCRMPYVDQIVVACLAASLIASLVVQWRRGLRGRRYLAGVFGLFYGLTLVVMLGFHCLDVAWGATHHLASMTGRPMTYDWRVYSLQLFGAVLIVQGVGCVRAAVRMGSADPAARLEVLRRTALVLAIVLPIIPIHAFFGYLIGGASTLTLAAVALGGYEARREVPAALTVSPV